MAYVRQRGNQVAIVQGERNPENGNVEQRILFTFYSKPEAKEALGPGAPNFQHLLEQRYPDVSFNWKAINKGLRENLATLPDEYQYREARLRSRFREDLGNFARQLVLADPQSHFDAAELICEHRHELAYVGDLIRWRLATCDQKKHPFNQDNPFLWRFALQGKGVPPDTEEHLQGLRQRGETDKLKAAVGLLVETFDDFADGHNSLGSIALDGGKVSDAVEHFRQAVTLGRRLFPKRLAKKHYWLDLSTRPYIRGLRNLANALNQAGSYEEALTVCDRLTNECGDDDAAVYYRAAVYLNTGRSADAVEQAAKIHERDPGLSFVAGFALSDKGFREEALVYFLHGLLNSPRTARMLVDERIADPKNTDEVLDHNGGVWLVRSIRPYLKKQSRESLGFLTQIWRDARVAAVVKEREAAAKRWFGQNSQDNRKDFDRVQQMKALDFARHQAGLLDDLVTGSGPRTFAPAPLRRTKH